MHVLYVPSWYPKSDDDTAGSFFREQAHSLRQSGMNVGVLAPIERPYYASWTPSRSFEGAIEKGIPVLRFQTPHPFPKLLSPNVWSARPTLIRAFDAYIQRWGRPDVLHAHSLFPAAYYCEFLSQTYGIPFVYTEHRSLMHLSTSALSLRQQRRIVESASARIGVSRGHADHLASRFKMDPQTWLDIPNLLPPIVESSGFVDSRDSRRFLVGHLSTLDPVKNIPSLVRAFSRAFADTDDVELWIAGDGEQRNHVRQMVEQSGKAHQIRLLGKLQRHEVPEFCGSLDLFVLPSLSESFGVVLTEALSQGAPVISTRTWGGEYIVGPGDGELVPVNDDDALVESLRRAYAHRESTSERAKRRQRTIARFGKDTFVSAYQDIYEKAIR